LAGKQPFKTMPFPWDTSLKVVADQAAQKDLDPAPAGPPKVFLTGHLEGRLVQGDRPFMRGSGLEPSAGAY
jgi:hypothetical protein